ncbi:MAG: dienelactone hydrolase family protein [Xanthomonadales bacterium]|nr:dienelactone hydrolase family protein [Xanthomonadales bacterium]
MKQFLLAAILMGAASMSHADIRTEEITYSGGGVEMKGYLAWDDAIEGERPGVLVVHEWWGHNEYPRKRAEMLAELGYTALALDMYGAGKTADHPNDAGAFMNAVLENMEAGRARFEAAHELLQAHATVDATRTAAIGYCFGGGVVLHMARMGADLRAVASFHGSLGMAVAPGVEDMNTRVVAYNGEADPFVSEEAIASFKAEMEKAGAHYDFIQLPGAIHGFSNPAATETGEKFGLPLKYDALADEASWAHMQLVFKQAFGD